MQLLASVLPGAREPPIPASTTLVANHVGPCAAGQRLAHTQHPCAPHPAHPPLPTRWSIAPCTPTSTIPVTAAPRNLSPHSFPPVSVRCTRTSPGQVAYRSLRPPLIELGARCPARLRQLVEDCWCQEPQRRLSSQQVGGRGRGGGRGGGFLLQEPGGVKGLLAAHGRMDQPGGGLSATGPYPGWARRDVPFRPCVGPSRMGYKEAPQHHAYQQPTITRPLLLAVGEDVRFCVLTCARFPGLFRWWTG